MSKKVQKTLTGAMAAMMATGVVATPAMAATNTNVDALYKAAYQATQKALTEKTQAAVNEARTAIKALPANMDWAIGEFSKQVDTVQHPILVNIVNSIKKAEKEPTQANINAAKKAIPAELTPVWKNSYSSAVDKLQQDLQKRTLDAVKKAEADKTKASIDAARVLVKDVLTADSQALKDWAKTLSNRLDAIKLYDLEITKATLSKSGVTVEFKALDEAVRDAKVEVIDNNGKVVEVETKSVLIEGETTWTFKFKTALNDRPEGTWKINGFAVKQDEVNLVADVQKKQTPQELFTLLEKSGLVDNLVDELENHKVYSDTISKLSADSKIKTIEDIQKAIDDANAEVGTTVKAEDVVKAAKNTLNKFKEIFAELNAKRVNKDWITSYKDAIANNLDAKTATISDIQNEIDAVNLVETLAPFSDNNMIVAKVSTDGKLDTAKIEKAIGYVEKYVVADENKEDEVKAKAAKIKSGSILLAIAELNEADTVVSFKAGLKNLAKVVDSKDVFDYDKLVNEDITSYYVKANTTNTTDVDGVKVILETGRNAAKVEAIKTLAEKANAVITAGNKVTEAQKTAVLDAYKKLATVTAKHEKFDASKVKADLVVEYSEKAAGYNETTTIATVTDDVKSINDNLVVNVLNKVKADKEKLLLSGLKEIGLNNIVDSNEKKYIAEIDVNLTTWTKDSLQNKVNAVNALANVLSSKDVTTVKNSLTIVAVNDGLTVDADAKINYVDLADLVKADVAELLVGRIADSDKAEITTLAELKVAVVEVNTDRIAKITAVNEAKNSTSGTVEALKTVSTEFKALDQLTQVSVAEKFNANRPTTTDKDGKVTVNDFKNFTEIRTLVNKVIK